MPSLWALLPSSSVTASEIATPAALCQGTGSSLLQGFLSQAGEAPAPQPPWVPRPPGFAFCWSLVVLIATHPVVQAPGPVTVQAGLALAKILRAVPSVQGSWSTGMPLFTFMFFEFLLSLGSRTL